MTPLRILETAASFLLVTLIGLVLLAWLLEELFAKTARIVDSFLIPAAERYGDLVAAWRRLTDAVRAASARWHEDDTTEPPRGLGGGATPAATAAALPVPADADAVRPARLRGA